MKSWPQVLLVFGLVVVLVAAVISSESCRATLLSFARPWLGSDRSAALEQINAIGAAAERGEVQVVECGTLAWNAAHNHAVLVEAARLVSTCPFHTRVIMGVARAAARAEREVPEMADLLELAVIKQTESAAIVRLAERAAEPRTEEEMRRVREQIATWREEAEFPSVEAAIAAAAHSSGQAE